MSADSVTRRTAAAAAGVRAWGGPLVVGAALATVAGTTGFISYTHICALTLQLHQSWKTAHLMPLAVDGQIVIGGAVLAGITGRGRWWGLVGVVPGLLESLFANWESGISHGLLPAVWAMVAAQSFACSSFLFEKWLRRVTAGGHDGKPGELSTEQAIGVLLASGSQRAVAAVLGVDRADVQRWARQLAEAGQEGAERAA